MPTDYIVFTANVQTAQAIKLRDAITRSSNTGHDIYLLISSGGGNVFEGLSTAALIKALPIKITTHNIGQTDSIANVIFAAGSPRYANPNASFMFHGVSIHYEKQDLIESQLEEQYKGAKRLREDIVAAFAAYTGMSISDVGNLMASGSTILTASEARTKTIINEVRNASVPPNTQIVTIGDA